MTHQFISATLPRRIPSSDSDFRWIAGFTLLIVLEGVFGKWISPSLEYPPVLMRDVVGLILIYRAWASGRFRQYPGILSALTIWTITIVLFAFLQALFLGFGITIVAIGLRFWIIYFWIALAIVCTLSARDYERFCDFLIRIAIFMAPLLILQNFSGPEAWINKATSEDANIFVVDSNIVRATGTFSFTFGFTCFLALVTPLLLAPSQHVVAAQRGNITRPAMFILMVMCAVISGSRAAMTFAATMFAISIVASLLIPGRSSFGTLLAGIGSLLTIVMLPAIMPETIAAVENRFLTAHEAEDPIERLRIAFIGSAQAWDAFSMGGRGLGLAANMTARFTGQASAGEFLLAEAEPERVLLAGGMIGLLWLAIKVGIALLGLTLSLRAAMQQANIRPLLLWLTASYALIAWSMTGQLSAHALGTIALAVAAASVGVLDRTRP